MKIIILFILLFQIIAIESICAQGAILEPRQHPSSYLVLKNESDFVKVFEELDRWSIVAGGTKITLSKDRRVYQCTESQNGSFCVLLIMRKSPQGGVGLWCDRLLTLRRHEAEILIEEHMPANDLIKNELIKSIVGIIELSNDGILQVRTSSYPKSGGRVLYSNESINLRE